MKAKNLSNHGIVNRNVVENFGYVSRMDNLQAGILNYHLKHLKKIISIRRRNAALYSKLLDKTHVFIPVTSKKIFHTYHTFVIQVKKRNKLMEFLKNKGIQTSIHYPIPIHLQPASKFLKYKRGSFPETESQSKNSYITN